MLEREKFAAALETLRSGIYVVTSLDGDKPAGCTCVWLSRISFAPPLLAVTLAPGRRTLEAIERSGSFCINVLGEGGLALARRFGFNSGPESSKFEGVEYRAAETGCPVLGSAVAWFDCKLFQALQLGDHKLVTGEVLSAGRSASPERPAVYIAESFYAEEYMEAQAEH